MGWLEVPAVREALLDMVAAELGQLDSPGAARLAALDGLLARLREAVPAEDGPMLARVLAGLASVSAWGLDPAGAEGARRDVARIEALVDELRAMARLEVWREDARVARELAEGVRTLAYASGEDGGVRRPSSTGTGGSNNSRDPRRSRARPRGSRMPGRATRACVPYRPARSACPAFAAAWLAAYAAFLDIPERMELLAPVPRDVARPCRVRGGIPVAGGHPLPSKTPSGSLWWPPLSWRSAGGTLSVEQRLALLAEARARLEELTALATAPSCAGDRGIRRELMWAMCHLAELTALLAG